jgi:hypothetical protein
MGSQGSRETDRLQRRHEAFEVHSRQVSARSDGRKGVWRSSPSPLRIAAFPPEGAPAVGLGAPLVDGASLGGSEIVRHWREGPRERGDFDAADSP